MVGHPLPAEAPGTPGRGAGGTRQNDAATAAPRALAFDAAAEQYAAHRPSYPPALLDAVEDLAGRPLAGAKVADVGAGTGIGTVLLDRRGADVIAVEPGAGMAARLCHEHPEIPLVRGDGNRLPLATASQDLLTFAQSWHWTDPRLAVPEARRVLRPGGSLALWWNHFDAAHGWLAGQHARIARFLGDDSAGHDTGGPLRDLPDSLPWATRRFHWARRVTLDRHLANLGSHSAFLVRGPEAAHAFLAEERARLARLFPDGHVEERYLVNLAVARC